MPRTSHFSCPFIVTGGSGSFSCSGKGFIGAFFRRLTCSTSWILTCGGNSSRYEYPTCSKILKGPAAYRLNLRLSWSVCQPLRDTQTKSPTPKSGWRRVLSACFFYLAYAASSISRALVQAPWQRRAYSLAASVPIVSGPAGLYSLWYSCQSNGYRAGNLSHVTGYPARSRDRSCDRHTVTATRSLPHGHRHTATATWSPPRGLATLGRVTCQVMCRVTCRVM